jgi:hypothetical protein
MDDLDIINQTLQALIKKIDDNPLRTLKDAEQLSVNLADQHFYVEKKLRLIVRDLEQVEWLLSEKELQPSHRRSLERLRPELVEAKRATEFGLIACRKLAEESDKVYYEAHEKRLNSTGLFFYRGDSS